ncbi:efflux transporter outer membrane subunit [Pokkaliibacter sp. CJK22405]|uniref:efflux transporter outer membrane subunit n=1 Tax=Pokkaliibacter sp. CJK22405 TaxID=3384615 RepID=UPI003984E972
MSKFFPSHTNAGTPMLSRTSLRAGVLVAMAMLAGCSSLAPNYQRPEASVPSAWPSGAAYKTDTSKQTAVELPWKSFIQDKRLQQVISLALQNNQDLKSTLADVAMARATYKEQRADLFPEVDAGISASRSKTQSSGTTESYEATAGLSSYEIDLFGKTRSLSNAELETYLASNDTARSARITLIGETASAWLTLATDQSLLKLAQNTADNAQRDVEITQRRLKLGIDSRVDVRNAETTYHTARADIASYTTLVAQDRNALELLVGQSLSTDLLPDGLTDQNAWLGSVPAGVSSSVLQERPDVLAAEHNLKAANANIGAARAAFFPSLSLTTTGGLASAALADLFSGGAATIWTVAPSLSLPIFDGGANRASLDYSKAEKDKMVATYRYTLQTAFKEVADALARRGTIKDQLNAEEDLVAAAQDSYNLSLDRYKNGIDSYLDTLDAQRTLYSAQQTLLSTRLTELDNRVTLYRVLGGGLVDDTTQQATTAAEVSKDE